MKNILPNWQRLQRLMVSNIGEDMVSDNVNCYIYVEKQFDNM